MRRTVVTARQPEPGTVEPCPSSRPAAEQHEDTMEPAGLTNAPRLNPLPGVVLSAPGKAWEGGKRCKRDLGNLSREPSGEPPRPAEVGHQPAPSVAWWRSDPPCEAYTGSVQAA